MDQKWKKWAPYAGFVLLALAVGGLSGWLTRDGVELYNQTAQKPPLSPPGWVFPVVWSVLCVLMGRGAARVYLAPPSEARRRGWGCSFCSWASTFSGASSFSAWAAMGWPFCGCL